MRHAPSDYTLREKAEWWSRSIQYDVAAMLGRHPQRCWPDLVTWAIGGWQGLFRDGDSDAAIRRGPQYVASCRADAAVGGACYCGKFATCEFTDSTNGGLRPDVIVPARVGTDNAD